MKVGTRHLFSYLWVRLRGEGAAPERMVQIIQILIYQRQHFYMRVDKLFLNVIWHEIIFFRNMIDFHTFKNQIQMTFSIITVEHGSTRIMYF